MKNKDGIMRDAADIQYNPSNDRGNIVANIIKTESGETLSFEKQRQNKTADIVNKIIKKNSTITKLFDRGTIT